MKTITAQHLKTMIDKKEDFVLINVLPEKSFEQAHIPGSHNVPNQRKTFVEDVLQLAGDKSRKIVLYCASRDCTASPEAAKKLRNAGFTHVIDFEDGMAGWKLAGFEVNAPVTAGR